MLDTNSIKSLTDLRSDPAGVIALAKNLAGPVYIFNRTKPVSVLMDIEEYEDLVDRLEDALDALEIKKLKKISKKLDFITHEEIKKKYGII